MTGTDFDSAFDLDAETIEAPTEPATIPYEEHARRALLIVFGVAFVVLTVVQIVLGLTQSPQDYQVVSAPLGGVNTVLAAALGAAAIYYFTRKD